MLLTLLVALCFPMLNGTCPAQTSAGADLRARSLELYRKGDCAGAMPIFQQLLEQQPKNAAFRKLLAQCLLDQKKWEDARMQFEIVMRDSPNDLDAVSGARAALTQLQKREQTAQSQVIETRAATTEQLRAKHDLEKVTDLMKTGHNAEAEQALKNMIFQRPDWLAPRQRLAELYSSTRRFAEAAEIYRNLAAASPSSATLFLHRTAQNLEWAEKFDDAARFYRLYLRQSPSDTSARMSLAQILIRAEQYQDAVTELKAVLDRRPDQLSAQIALAECYERLDTAELALDAYNRVLQLDPKNIPATRSRNRLAKYFDEAPLRRGFAAVDKRDWPGAIREFQQYLQTHPGSLETTLRIARLYSVAQDFNNAATYYHQYLERQPADDSIRRELAKMQMWAQNYPSARAELQKLTLSPSASVQDYETLVQAFVWGGDLNGAEPYAEKLAKMQAGNSLASQTLQDIREHRRYEARQAADRLVAERRFLEAIEAYRRYMAAYGTDQQSQLLICRLYSWGRDFTSASNCYHEYLIAYATDADARLELADISKWSGKYVEAELQYRKLLEADPKNAAARMGLAESMQNRNEDPTKVQTAFRDVLRTDPQNTVARQRANEVHTLVAPTLQIAHSSFADTDGLYWALNTVTATFTLPGRVRLSPFYSSGYFSQNRIVRGSTFGIASVNQKIAIEGGTLLANGGGLRIEVAPSARWTFAADAGGVTFNGARTTATGHAELVYRPSSKQSFGISYIRRDAILDLWTLASLASGTVGDTVLLSSQQMLGSKWRLGMVGGFTRYTGNSELSFSSNTQRRLWAQIDYPVRSWLRLGYVYRLSSFVSRSPIYFSPSMYQTHGLAYGIDRAVNDRLSLTASGELSYSRVDGGDNIESSVLPAITWKIGKGFVLDLGYRFSLSQTSAFSTASYQTQGGEIRLKKVF